MANSVLGEVLVFLARIGIYDVVLPFLLVFTLLFAFLEKTKVLGVEIIKDKNGDEHYYTRKNLNSMIAFVSAFFVIASSQLVRILSEVIANTMILIVTGVCFMLAIGVSHTGTGEFDLGVFGRNSAWKKGFWAVNAIGIILILLNALGWLDAIYDFLLRNWSNGAVATIIMILVFVGFMAWVTSGGKPSPQPKESKD
jgi:uncharacterized membrane protein